MAQLTNDPTFGGQVSPQHVDPDEWELTVDNLQSGVIPKINTAQFRSITEYPDIMTRVR